MSSYVGVHSVAEKNDKLYWGDGAGIARAVQKAYFGDPRGVAELWHQRGTPLGALDVGSLVHFAVGGVRTPWLVVHQGLPGDMYDDSCNGTWLLMLDCYADRAWNSSGFNHSYISSTVNKYLNEDFLGLLDAGVQGVVKSVKIPYVTGRSTSATVLSGQDGLPAKVFLLSAKEVGMEYVEMPREGAALKYFEGCIATGKDAKRVAKYNGLGHNWWLRTPDTNSSNGAILVLGTGAKGNGQCALTTVAYRPALVLPQAVLVDKNNNVVGG